MSLTHIHRYTLIAAACFIGAPSRAQDAQPPVPAESVCTRLVEPKLTVPVSNETEFAAEVTIKDGKLAMQEILVVRGAGDRRTQRMILTALQDANMQLRCEGFTGKVTRRFVIPATPAEKS
jgi:hypothetical protein